MMKLPGHVGIIMDGNGRWAEGQGRHRTFGHIKGARMAKKIITACVQKKISHLTLYAFSSENWLRPEAEVSFLMFLLKRHLQRERRALIKQNIRFTVIGEVSRLPQNVRAEIDETVRVTAQNTGLHLTFAISYGARQEITSAMQQIAIQVAEGQLLPQDITEETIQSALWTKETPDPDLIIRTSGESRLSNFLLWQCAYSEFYFTETLWPDFNEIAFDQALNSFMARERRFGAVKPMIASPSTSSEKATKLPLNF